MQKIKYSVTEDTPRDLERLIVEPADLKNTMVIFKSWPKYYDLEERGLKPNTTRYISTDDPRIRILRSMKLNGAYGYVYIRDSEEPRLYFVRRIKSITEYKKNIIISWWPCFDNWLNYILEKYITGW